MCHNAVELKAELERLRSPPSLKEALEKEKAVLEDGVKKLHKMIKDEDLSLQIEQEERVLAEKEKQEKVNEEKWKWIYELKWRVEAQTFNARDVERMKKEL